jgi:hypothetical protein
MVRAVVMQIDTEMNSSYLQQLWQYYPTMPAYMGFLYATLGSNYFLFFPFFTTGKCSSRDEERFNWLRRNGKQLDTKII